MTEHRDRREPAAPQPQQPRVHVRGVDRSGSLCADRWLRHGDDPQTVLLGQGWEPSRLVSITTLRGDGPGLELALDYRVSKVVPRELPAPEVPHERGMQVREGELPIRYQRVAAYAVVRSARGYLMTELSQRTSRPGSWGLPGGGIEPGEEPDDAVLREVWEETGQHVQLRSSRAVITQHWVGRAPSGRLEDYHAIRLVYDAVCLRPTDPVVHDIGGTTASAAWMDPEQLVTATITSWARPLLSDVGG